MVDLLAKHRGWDKSIMPYLKVKRRRLTVKVEFPQRFWSTENTENTEENRKAKGWFLDRIKADNCG